MTEFYLFISRCSRWGRYGYISEARRRCVTERQQVFGAALTRDGALDGMQRAQGGVAARLLEDRGAGRGGELQEDFDVAVGVGEGGVCGEDVVAREVVGACGLVAAGAAVAERGGVVIWRGGHGGRRGGGEGEGRRGGVRAGEHGDG